MNTRKAAPVLVIGSLAVLLSGCAGAAAQGQVNDYLKPLENAAAIGLARGHVIAENDFSADARRELHSQRVQSVTVEQPFSAEVWRELKGSAPTTVEQPFSDAAKRELKGSAPVTVEQPFSDAAKRELKGSAPVGETAADMQGKRLSAYAEAYAAANAPTTDPVDDVLSPLGGPR